MKQPQTSDEIELVASFPREYLPLAEEMTGPNYGPYMGGDARNFNPDPECSIEEQRKRHRQACEAWERGERRFATGFGYGSTHNGAEEESCRRLRSLLDELA